MLIVQRRDGCVGSQHIGHGTEKNVHGHLAVYLSFRIDLNESLQRYHRAIDTDLSHYIAALTGFRHEVGITAPKGKKYEAHNCGLTTAVLTANDVHSPVEGLIIGHLVFAGYDAKPL